MESNPGNCWITELSADNEEGQENTIYASKTAENAVMSNFGFVEWGTGQELITGTSETLYIKSIWKYEIHVTRD